MAYNICHFAMSHASSLIPISSALITLYQGWPQWPLYTSLNLHQCISELLCQVSSSDSCGSCYSLCMNFFPTWQLMQAVSCNPSSQIHMCIVVTMSFVAAPPALHRRLFSDQRLPSLTAQHQLHHQLSSPLHWPIQFVCLGVTYCLYVSWFTTQ